ncbi:glomulin-like [Uloborus diversus]|uniref:glomulin-like n=1 Tax=Uloborus diversus TaxID=327109 RepID=UPI002409672D|nr:glomulin-like [Uloborus diversus]
MNRSGNSLEDELQCLLLEKKFDNALDCLKKADNESFVTNNVWNLINTVCLTLKTNDDLLKNDSDTESCKKLLVYLVNKGKPKEMLVALMEEADSFKSHEYFSLLLEPLKETLKKIPGKRGKSLEWILSSLNAHIQTLSVPNNLDLQDEEKLLLDVDPAVMDANYVLYNYWLFLSSFVEEVSLESISEKVVHYSDQIKHQQDILCKYILLLFNHPLLYHDLHVPDESRPKSSIRTICDSYVKLISKMCRNVFNIFRYDENSSVDMNTKAVGDEECCVPLLAFSHLSYLMFCEKIAMDFQPLVYSHQYLFIFNLKYELPLLSKGENLVLFKGLKLARVLCDNLEEFELGDNCLELELFTKFPMTLLNIAISCPIETHRKNAVEIFLNFMSKCSWKVKYHIIMQVISNVKHSGAEGLVIGLYKNYLHDYLCEKTSNSYFFGKNLHLFLKTIFVLSDGVETDLLQNSDKILSSLNFLRYLLLKDVKENNITGVWNLSKMITDQFLEPLKTGLDLSRAHYEQAAKTFQCNQQQNKENPEATINNSTLKNIPPEMEKDMYEKALITFDMIESILSRVTEVLN